MKVVKFQNGKYAIVRRTWLFFREALDILPFFWQQILVAKTTLGRSLHGNKRTSRSRNETL